ncbi:MAG: guanylate kinase, partial [Candidatus Acidiferrales bacterium]
DNDEEIGRRLERAGLEMEHYVHYDYVVINEDLEQAGDAVRAIALGARCRTRQNRERVQRILKSFGG